MCSAKPSPMFWLPVEGLDSSQQLLVVATVNEDLCVVLHRLGEHRQGTGVELLLFSLLELLRSHLRLGLRQQTPEYCQSEYRRSTNSTGQCYSPGQSSPLLLSHIELKTKQLRCYKQGQQNDIVIFTTILVNKSPLYYFNKKVEHLSFSLHQLYFQFRKNMWFTLLWLLW